MTKMDVQQFIGAFVRHKPTYVAVTLDLERNCQYLKVTYEWHGKLAQFSDFLCEVRDDLEERGLSVQQIDVSNTGISFARIRPEHDPDGTAFPVFHLKSTAEFEREYQDFLEIAKAMRQRMQEARDE